MILIPHEKHKVRTKEREGERERGREGGGKRGRGRLDLNGSVFSLRYLSDKALTRKTKRLGLSGSPRHHLSCRSGGLAVAGALPVNLTPKPFLR